MIKRNERGQSLVEFILVIPIILLFLYGLIDVSFAFSKKLVLNDMTKELSRAASIGQDVDELKRIASSYSEEIEEYQDIQSQEEVLADGTSLTRMVINLVGGKKIEVTFTPSLLERTKGDEMRVEADYSYTPITPLFEPFLEIPIRTQYFTIIEVSL